MAGRVGGIPALTLAIECTDCGTHQLPGSETTSWSRRLRHGSLEVRILE